MRELTTVREINQACRAHATNGGQPVYCTAPGYPGNIRIVSAQTVKGMMAVKAANGQWIFGTQKVFTLE